MPSPSAAEELGCNGWYANAPDLLHISFDATADLHEAVLEAEEMGLPADVLLGHLSDAVRLLRVREGEVLQVLQHGKELATALAVAQEEVASLRRGGGGEYEVLLALQDRLGCADVEEGVNRVLLELRELRDLVASLRRKLSPSRDETVEEALDHLLYRDAANTKLLGSYSRHFDGGVPLLSRGVLSEGRADKGVTASPRTRSREVQTDDCEELAMEEWEAENQALLDCNAQFEELLAQAHERLLDQEVALEEGRRFAARIEELGQQLSHHKEEGDVLRLALDQALASEMRSRDEAARLEEEVRLLQDRVVELELAEKELGETRTEAKMLRERLLSFDTVKVQLEESQLALDQAIVDGARAQCSIDTLEQELTELRSAAAGHDAAQREVTEMQAEMRRLQEVQMVNAQMQTEFMQLQEKIASLEDAKQKLKEEVIAANRQEEATRLKMREADKKTAQLEEALGELREELQEVIEEKEALAQQIRGSMTTEESDELRRLQSRVVEQEKEIATLQRRGEELAESVRVSEEQCSLLMAQCRGSDEGRALIEQAPHSDPIEEGVREGLAACVRYVHQLQESSRTCDAVARLEAQVEDMHERETTLHATIATLQDKVADAEQAKEALLLEMRSYKQGDGAQAALREAVERAAKAEAAVLEKEVLLGELKGMVKASSEELHALREKLKQKEALEAILQEGLDSAHAELEALDDDHQAAARMRELRKELDEVRRNSAEDVQRTVTELVTARQELEAVKQGATKEKLHAAEQMKAAGQALEKAKAEEDRLRGEVEELSKGCAEAEALRKRVDELEKELRETKEEGAATTQSLFDQLVATKQALADAKEQVEKEVEARERLGAERAKEALAELQRTTLETEQLKKTLSDTTSELTATQSKVSHENNRLLTMAETLREAQQRLQEQVAMTESIEAELEATNTKLADAQRRVADLLHEVDSLREEQQSASKKSSPRFPGSPGFVQFDSLIETVDQAQAYASTLWAQLEETVQVDAAQDANAELVSGLSRARDDAVTLLRILKELRKTVPQSSVDVALSAMGSPGVSMDDLVDELDEAKRMLVDALDDKAVLESQLEELRAQLRSPDELSEQTVDEVNDNVEECGEDDDEVAELCSQASNVTLPTSPVVLTVATQTEPSIERTVTMPQGVSTGSVTTVVHTPETASLRRKTSAVCTERERKEPDLEWVARQGVVRRRRMQRSRSAPDTREVEMLLRVAEARNMEDVFYSCVAAAAAHPRTSPKETQGEASSDTAPQASLGWSPMTLPPTSSELRVPHVPPETDMGASLLSSSASLRQGNPCRGPANVPLDAPLLPPAVSERRHPRHDAPLSSATASPHSTAPSSPEMAKWGSSAPKRPHHGALDLPLAPPGALHLAGPPFLRRGGGEQIRVPVALQLPPEPERHRFARRTGGPLPGQPRTAEDDLIDQLSIPHTDSFYIGSSMRTMSPSDMSDTFSPPMSPRRWRITCSTASPASAPLAPLSPPANIGAQRLLGVHRKPVAEAAVQITLTTRSVGCQMGTDDDGAGGLWLSSASSSTCTRSPFISPCSSPSSPNRRVAPQLYCPEPIVDQAVPTPRAPSPPESPNLSPSNSNALRYNVPSPLLAPREVVLPDALESRTLRTRGGSGAAQSPTAASDSTAEAPPLPAHSAEGDETKGRALSLSSSASTASSSSALAPPVLRKPDNDSDTDIECSSSDGSS